MTMIDPRRRQQHNLRRRYCMPAGGVIKVGHNGLPSCEELLRIADTAAAADVAVKPGDHTEAPP